jgi:hypothetical protein
VISDEASRALKLIKGIEVVKQTSNEYQTSDEFWAGVVTWIILDIDEGADERQLIRVRETLQRVWDILEDKKQ